MIKKNIVLVISILLNTVLLFYIANHRSNPTDRAEIITMPKSVGVAYCEKFDQHSRVKADDLSANLRSFETSRDNIYEWDICKSQTNLKKADTTGNSSSILPSYGPVEYCPFSPRVEQGYQFQFYATNGVLRWPQFSSCVILPPKNYQWPSKQTKYPAATGDSAIFWSNLGLKSFNEVSTFNEPYTKNVYHFDSSLYDIQQEVGVNLAAQYIPFGKKIRTMLEIGGGSGSLAVSLSKRYDVTVINTVRPEFPYCEYITERGGLCILLDSVQAMPFAKFSFDVVHHSWVYHSLTPAQWRTVVLEQNRLLRPGGYLWMQDGSSNAVVETIKYVLVEQLGYKVLYKRENKIPLPTTTYFGADPFESEWCFIFVKPNRLKDNRYPCN